MRRKAKKKEKPPKFIAPRDPTARSELRARLDKAWPHRAGTRVVCTKPGKDPREAETRSISFYNPKGVAVAYVSDNYGGREAVAVRCLKAI